MKENQTTFAQARDDALKKVKEASFAKSQEERAVIGAGAKKKPDEHNTEDDEIGWH